jgi:hypothetical protein
VLQRLRGAGVNDEPDVGAVDPHAERHRRHHDVGVLVDELVLMSVPLRVVEPRVVRDGANPRGREPRRQRVHLAPRRAVDDAGIAAMARENLLELCLEARARHHAVDEIRPIE